MTNDASPTAAIEFHEVDGARWADLARLFEGRGGPKHCWCMVWREAGPNRGALTNDDRRALLEQRVRAGTPIGLLAYIEGEPVAWCSVAPRETFRERALGGPPAAPDEVVWSIVCFFAQRRLRGAGVGRALLTEAVRVAASHGATTVEAYPVDPDAPSYRYMGFTSMFRAAGFRELGRAGTRRHVMRLQVARQRSKWAGFGAVPAARSHFPRSW
jgi:GNAT superfamily N-acetyltransferase